MAFGNVIRLRNYRHQGTDGKSWAEYRHAEKDKVFLAVVIGEAPKVETKENEITPDDVVMMMQDLGWKKMTETQFRAHAKKRGLVLRDDT